jgi:mannose-1-phosphate guanylyltransferase/mannose-6-phosphate isomerase
MPVILSGGSGKRLWPLSTDACPKQFLPLTGCQTLLQLTAMRTALRAEFGPMTVIANNDHRFLVAEQMRQFGVKPLQIVLEPLGRNTAPAAAVAAILAAEADPDTLVLLMPADHMIGDTDAFLAAVAVGAEAARQGEFVLFGIRPDRPATGYGYIEVGEALKCGEQVRRVRRFVEKPTRPTAKSYLASGDFLWNSGIFLLPAVGFLTEIKRLAPRVYAAAREAVDKAVLDADFLRLDGAFAAAPAISIDHAIFEKTDRAAVIEVAMNWTDIGSWSAVWDLASKDVAGNVTVGAVLAEKTSNSYLRSEGPFLATIGIKDVIVIATRDAVLVIDKAHDQEVKRVVEQLEAGVARLTYLAA